MKKFNKKTRNTKLDERMYKQVHITAKLIVCIVVTTLISIAQVVGLPLSIFLNGIAVFIWFFGVNAVGYAIEEVLHCKHFHDKL